MGSTKLFKTIFLFTLSEIEQNTCAGTNVLVCNDLFVQVFHVQSL